MPGPVTDSAAKDTARTFEPNDVPCFRFGDPHRGTAAPNLVSGCEVAFFSIGDHDDGIPFYRD